MKTRKVEMTEVVEKNGVRDINGSISVEKKTINIPIAVTVICQQALVAYN